MFTLNPFNRLQQIVALIAWSFCLMLLSVQTASGAVRKVEIEVVSTFKIIKLCEWDPDYSDPLVIGVYDSTEYLDIFHESAKSVVAKHLFQEPIKIVHLDADSDHEELAGCDVIFCDSKNRKSIESLAKSLGNSPTLLVGSSKDFLESGGMVRFSYSNGQLLFAINERKGGECGIRFRSSLLALASEVIR